MEPIILQPTEQFINKLVKTRHLLNNPTVMFNEMINQQVRGYDDNKAEENLKVLLTKYGCRMATVELRELINFHRNISVVDLRSILSQYSWTDNYPDYVVEEQEKINKFYMDKERRLREFHSSFKHTTSYNKIAREEWVFEEL